MQTSRYCSRQCAYGSLCKQSLYFLLCKIVLENQNPSATTAPDFLARHIQPTLDLLARAHLTNPRPAYPTNPKPSCQGPSKQPQTFLPRICNPLARAHPNNPRPSDQASSTKMYSSCTVHHSVHVPNMFLGHLRSGCCQALLVALRGCRHDTKSCRLAYSSMIQSAQQQMPHEVSGR